ncbi:MAG: citrate transporter [Acidobacteria bacterium]|nr:citrate transporter [Acidobacteriota bacterium]
MAGTVPVAIGPVPVDFILFALTLLGVAIFPHRAFTVAVTGLTAILAWKSLVVGFKHGAGLGGFTAHVEHEWVVIANVFLLLLGFAVLSRHFETSNVPEKIPAILPDNWLGGVVLLVLVFVLSSFLDNIAAAMIGGIVAKHVFHGKVHVGYIAALVAASNAGGAGSVVGDTTTTMIWIDGVNPLDVLHAYVASLVALVVISVPASLAQQKFHPIQKAATEGITVDWGRVFVVVAILLTAIGSNVAANLYFPAMLDQLPVIGIGVWGAIVVTSLLRRPDWGIVGSSLKGTLFLLCLVMSASLMPVESLPPASWPTSMGLGFVSAVFDNIPLTALALAQGGYDWGVLAFAVGFGGSMMWFGSSAGVAISNIFPEAKSVWTWITQGWFVILAYVLGFMAMILLLGWHPHAPHH